LDQLQPFGTDGKLFVGIVLAWIDQRLSIADEVVAKREVIGIRGRPRRVERIDLDFMSFVLAKDLCTCKDNYVSRALVPRLDGVGALKAE